MTSRIYTRTGDEGTTALADGTRVPKSELRLEAYGTIDEANSWVGVARAFTDDARLGAILESVQHRLYNCSSNVAMPEPSGSAVSIADADIAFLERAIDALDAAAGAIRGFVLPGGSRVASFLHVARTVGRRAERLLWSLAEEEEVDPNVLKYLNRASDLLFAAARCANHLEIGGDVLWDKAAPEPKL
jgi:cob(I)alamin adenosyltransferase